jgi:chorismate dehydratase
VETSRAAPDPTSGPLRAGSVPYLNVAPLVWGLESRLRLLPPSHLAVALRRGEVDAGLLSSSEALLNDGYDILDGPCVASDGEVFSVLVAHRRPIEEAKVVHCHAASLASVNLLRVLLAERGLNPELRSLEDPAMAASLDHVLLIGDPAIEFHLSARDCDIWDLGTAWRELTGLPFVYAAWVLRRAADTRELRAILREAAARGRRELDEVIRCSRGFDEDFRRRYLTGNTRHELGDREKEGLRTFGELLRKHGFGPVFEPRFV